MSFYGNRNRMTRLVLDKIENDNYLNQLDHNQWYIIPDLEKLPYSMFFYPCSEDDETKKFLENCFEKSEWFLTQLFHSLMLSMLKWFMATTSINGLLQRGSMFVFSMQQFRQLIDFDTRYGSVKLDNLLDLGSGDGAVTARMAPFFNNIYCTEMSSTMQWRLAQKGYKVLGIDEWANYKLNSMSEPMKYDAISVLNLLDRCDKPLTLLRQIKQSLNSDGLLIIALVLPFKPYVEYNQDNKPLENLFDNQLDFINLALSTNSSKSLRVINQIDLFIKQVTSLGFDLLKFTKLPYLCEGNLQQSYYFMLDYMFIFKNKD